MKNHNTKYRNSIGTEQLTLDSRSWCNVVEYAYYTRVQTLHHIVESAPTFIHLRILRQADHDWLYTSIF